MHKLPKQRCGTHNCPECNKLTKCDLENGKSVCWCFSVEVVNKLEHNAGNKCMCKSCLTSVQYEESII